MDLMKTAHGIALAMAALAASAVGAIVVECNSCNQATASQAAMVAEGRILVANFATGELWAFQSEIAQSHIDREGVFEVLGWTVLPGQLTSEEQAEIRLLAQVWRDNGGGFKSQITLGPGDPGYPHIPSNLDAFDIVQAGINRNALSTALVSNEFTRSLPTRFQNQLSALTTILMNSRVGDVPEARIIIIFENGSRVEYVFTPSTVQSPQYVMGSARDRVGNPIPDQWSTLAQSDNQWYFDRRSDFEAMFNHFRQAGIRFHDPNGLGNGGQTAWTQLIGPNQRVRIRCEHDGSGNAVSCSIEIIPVLEF